MHRLSCIYTHRSKAQHTLTITITLTFAQFAWQFDSNQIESYEMKWNKMKWTEDDSTHVCRTVLLDVLLRRTLLKTSVKKRYECGWNTISTFKVLNFYSSIATSVCVCVVVMFTVFDLHSRTLSIETNKWNMNNRMVLMFRFWASINTQPDDCFDLVA